MFSAFKRKKGKAKTEVSKFYGQSEKSISTPAQVRSIGASVDGVIVGSAIVDAFHRGDLQAIETLVKAANEKVHN